jgi:hypothetical protein
MPPSKKLIHATPQPDRPPNGQTPKQTAPKTDNPPNRQIPKQTDTHTHTHKQTNPKTDKPRNRQPPEYTQTPKQTNPKTDKPPNTCTQTSKPPDMCRPQPWRCQWLSTSTGSTRMALHLTQLRGWKSHTRFTWNGF